MWAGSAIIPRSNLPSLLCNLYSVDLQRQTGTVADNLANISANIGRRLVLRVLYCIQLLVSVHLALSISYCAELIVDGSKKNYSSIQAAIDSGKAGDTIVVKPGTYKESLLLREGITVKGEDVDKCVVIGQQAPAVTLRNLRSAKIESLTLTASGGLYTSAVTIFNSQVVITKCAVKDCPGSGVEITGMKKRRGNQPLQNIG